MDVHDTVGADQDEAARAVAAAEGELGIAELPAFHENGVARVQEWVLELGAGAAIAGEHDPGHARPEEIIEGDTAEVGGEHIGLREVSAGAGGGDEESRARGGVEIGSAQGPSAAEQRRGAEGAQRGLEARALDAGPGHHEAAEAAGERGDVLDVWAAFFFVRIENGLAEPPLDDTRELEREVRGVAEAGREALSGEGGHDVRGVTGEEETSFSPLLGDEGAEAADGAAGDGRFCGAGPAELESRADFRIIIDPGAVVTDGELNLDAAHGVRQGHGDRGVVGAASDGGVAGFAAIDEVGDEPGVREYIAAHLDAGAGSRDAACAVAGDGPGGGEFDRAAVGVGGTDDDGVRGLMEGVDTDAAVEAEAGRAGDRVEQLLFDASLMDGDGVGVTAVSVALVEAEEGAVVRVEVGADDLTRSSADAVFAEKIGEAAALPGAQGLVVERDGARVGRGLGAFLDEVDTQAQAREEDRGGEADWAGADDEHFGGHELGLSLIRDDGDLLGDGAAPVVEVPRLTESEFGEDGEEGLLVGEVLV